MFYIGYHLTKLMRTDYPIGMHWFNGVPEKNGQVINSPFCRPTLTHSKSFLV